MQIPIPGFLTQDHSQNCSVYITFVWPSVRVAIATLERQLLGRCYGVTIRALQVCCGAGLQKPIAAIALCNLILLFICTDEVYPIFCF